MSYDEWKKLETNNLLLKSSLYHYCSVVSSNSDFNQNQHRISNRLVISGSGLTLLPRLSHIPWCRLEHCILK